MTSEISYSEFIEMVENGEVESVVLRSVTLTITPKIQRSMAGTTEIYTTLMEDESELTSVWKMQEWIIFPKSLRI